jgi:hypothetical protein
VSKTGEDLLEVELYSHSTDQCQIVMRIWQLTPGDYRLRFEPHELETREKTITVQGRGQRFRITLPSQRLLRVRLERIP